MEETLTGKGDKDKRKRNYKNKHDVLVLQTLSKNKVSQVVESGTKNLLLGWFSAYLNTVIALQGLRATAQAKYFFI